MVSGSTERDDLSVAALRVLSAQTVENAQSGHPGMPLGVADVAFVLWTRILRYMPDDPQWIARDRFILSAGHASALVYSLLHLAGYGLSANDLARFRQMASPTPGHPERGATPGIEMTTGPLGQGLGASVGMALGLKMLEARFRSSAFPGLGSRVFVLASDGDMMEGISSEAGSLAAHLRLDNLIVIYDSNRVSIDGSTTLAFSERVDDRFRAFGWHVSTVDGYDRASIERALREATSSPGAPKLIVAKTVLAKGVPGGEGDHHLHGTPLGPARLQALKEALNWPESEPFAVPAAAYEPFRDRVARVREDYNTWQCGFARWREMEPDRAALWDTMFGQCVPEDFETNLMAVVGTAERATRLHSSAVLARAACALPWLAGGSADLTESNGIPAQQIPAISRDSYEGQRLHFGIREHAMGAAANGLALTGAFRPFVATFLTFSDYMRPAIRLAAMMKLPVIYLFSHDSIFLGEDGPTHQPVEHLAALRAIPGMTVFRPADGPEVAAVWAWTLRNQTGPTTIVLTRQKVPAVARDSEGLPPVERGAYVVRDIADPVAVVVATGSEVTLALETAKLAQKGGIGLRVVSMPSMELFTAQPPSYRDAVIPPGMPVLGIEAATGFGWERIVGRQGLFIGVPGFGASAPMGMLRKAFGLEPESVLDAIRTWRSTPLHSEATS